MALKFEWQDLIHPWIVRIIHCGAWILFILQHGENLGSGAIDTSLSCYVGMCWSRRVLFLHRLVFYKFGRKIGTVLVGIYRQPSLKWSGLVWKWRHGLQQTYSYPWRIYGWASNSQPFCCLHISISVIKPMKAALSAWLNYLEEIWKERLTQWG